MRCSIKKTGFCLLCGAAVSVCAADAEAQTNSLFGNSGAVSQSGGSFNQIGNTAAGGARGAGGGLGGGLGSAGGAQDGIGTGPTMSATGSLGAQVGQNGLAGTQGTSQGFIGSAQGNQQTGGIGRSGFGGASSANNFSSLQGGRGGSNQFGGGARGGNQFGSQQGTASRSAQRALSLRPQQRVAFEFQAVADEAITTNLSRRFEALTPADGTTDGAPARIAAELGEGGLVTLRGTVESPSAKRLAEALARMEPGIRTVVNELEVRGE
jgi:osmotically-inducible protein OsmY